MPGSGVISCSGPACARMRPVRALYKPDGKHTYVGRLVRSAAYAYKIISSKGSCCAGIHLWLVLTCACRSLSRSPLSQPRSDARTKINRYRTLFGWVVSGSWYLLAIARGGLTMKALHLGTICAFVRGFLAPDRQGRWASPRWFDLS